MADKLDKSNLQTLFEGIRDERRLQANTANRIGNAFLSLLHFCADETSDRYLSRKHDDAAEGMITFLRGLISEQMAQFKEAPGSVTSCPDFTTARAGRSMPAAMPRLRASPSAHTCGSWS